MLGIIAAIGAADAAAGNETADIACEATAGAADERPGGEGPTKDSSLSKLSASVPTLTASADTSLAISSTRADKPSKRAKTAAGVAAGVLF